MEKQLNKILKELQEDKIIISTSGRFFFKREKKSYMLDYELTDLERKVDLDFQKEKNDLEWRKVYLSMFVILCIALIIGYGFIYKF